MSFVNNIFNMSSLPEQKMVFHVAVLVSQFAQLALVGTELQGLTKLAITITTLKKDTEFEQFITSAGAMKEDNHTRW